MATFPFARSQRSATRIIKRWGGPLPGKLVREGTSRNAWMARLEYKPSERGLYLDGACRLYVSTEGISIPPEYQKDDVEYGGVKYRILTPVLGPRPNGTIIFYDLNVIEYS